MKNNKIMKKCLLLVLILATVISWTSAYQSSSIGGWSSGNDNNRQQGSRNRPDSTSSSLPFGSSGTWSGGSGRGTEASESISSDWSNDGSGNRRPATGSSNRRPGQGADWDRDTGTTPKPEGKGVIQTIFGTMKNVSGVTQAIFSGDKKLISKTISTFMREVNSCIGTAQRGWSDPELGNFTIDKNSPYCNKACLRNFFCCAPMRPEEIDVKFIFSDSKKDHNLLRLNDPEARRVLNRQSNKKIVWIIHGLINDVFIEPIFNQTRDAYIDRGFNVILVDWHKANRLYMQAMANVRIVGALTGQLMDQYGLADRSICAGFSLGSHICGEAGSFLKRKGKLLYKCHGIDPAGPGYDGCSNDIRLDRGDCGVVTAIHTSQFTSVASLLGEEGLGTKVKSGHCDFWPNDGQAQPKCDNTTVPAFGKWLFTGKFGKLGSEFEHALTCSHWRGMNYYLSQVRKRCNFVGIEGECGGGTACRRDNFTTDGSSDSRNGRLRSRSKRQIEDDSDYEPSAGGRRRRPGAQSGSFESGFGSESFGSGSRRPGHGGSSGIDSFSESTGRRPGRGSGGNRRPGSGFGGDSDRPDSETFSLGGNRRPGSGFGSQESGFSSGGRRPGFGSIENEGSRPDEESGFGSGGHRRPGQSSGRPGNSFGQEAGQGFGSGGHRPDSGSRPAGGWGSGRPGNGFGAGGDSDSEFGSGSGNRPISGSRPGSGSGWGPDGDRRPSSGGQRPGSSGSHRPDSGTGSLDGDDSSDSENESHGSWSGGLSGQRPGQSGNRPNQGSSSTTGGWGGGRPSQGSGGGRPGMGSGNFQGNGAPLRLEMPLSPDDLCDARYDYDYKFKTSGREPFC